MNKLKILTFAAVAALVLFACKKEEEPKPEQPIIKVTDKTYAGKITVVLNGDSSISDLDIQVITDTSKTDSVVLFFRQVKFVPAMPGMDIKIPVTSSAQVYPAVLSGTGVTPYLVAGTVDTPFPSFRVDNIQGIVTNDSLKVAMDFFAVKAMGTIAQGSVTPTSFAGAVKK